MEPLKFKRFCTAQAALISCMDPPNVANNALLKPLTLYGGTAKECCTGPPIGLIDIGVCDKAYFFRVSLPGLRTAQCKVQCEIERDGIVYIKGEIPADGGGILKDSVGVYQTRVQQMCLPGLFTLSFQLPGPVDPRLMRPTFRNDGIFEVVVMKLEETVIDLDGGIPRMV